MKTKLMKFAMLCAIAFNLTGCGPKYLDGNIQVPSDSDAAKNNNTKLYYEDTNNAVIKEDIKNIVSFLNKDVIICRNLAVQKSTEEAKSYYDYKFIYIKNTEDKTLNLKFNVDENSNYIIVANKKYSSRNEAYLEFFQIREYIFEQLDAQSDLKDKFNTSGKMFYIDENALDSGVLKFTTKREKARQILSEKISRAYSNSGYVMVNNPKDADKIVYFQLTRDYYKSEIEKLKNEGKNINLGVIQSGMSNQFNLMQTSMNIASLNNSSASSVGIGLAAGLIGGILSQDRDPNVIFPTFKMIDVKENKSFLINTSAMSKILIEDDHSATISSEEQNSLYYDIKKANQGSTYLLTPLN